MDKPMVWQALRDRIALNLTSVACRLSAVPRHPVTVMGLRSPGCSQSRQAMHA
jgi:dihydroorotate dehydrogenase